MSLNCFLTSTACFLENVGYLRLSAFYSSENSSQGKFVQKIARMVLGIFATLIVYDLISSYLPFKIKIVMQGSCLILITCLALSLLLKRIEKFMIQPENTPPLKKKVDEEIDENAKKVVEKVDIPIFDVLDDKISPEKTIRDFLIEETPIKKNKKGVVQVRRNLFADFERVAVQDGLKNG